MDVIADPVVKAYLFYGAIVLGKMMIMSVLTALTRMRKGVHSGHYNFATICSYDLCAGSCKSRSLKYGKIKFDDQDVERVRRCANSFLLFTQTCI